MSEKKAVSFTLLDDPQVYVLQFDFNAICEAETATGCNLMHALAGGGISASETRGLLYACLKASHPEVLLSEAGDLLSRDMSSVLPALSKCLAEARDIEEESEPVKVPEKAAGPVAA